MIIQANIFFLSLGNFASTSDIKTIGSDYSKGYKLAR